jgi:class 3 adenylate cyclase
LPDARGDSSLVIAVFVDVRDFTTYFGESIESAVFIKKAYQRIIRDFYPNAAFVKSTGDGLMLVYEVEESELSARCNATVSSAISLVGEFPRLLAADPLVNFSTPDRIGIGLARGAACKLVSGDIVLDYSGRTLNLAARLMDLARPQGIVMDGEFGFALLSPEVQARFEPADVYLRGISPEKPRHVFSTRGITIIPNSALRPLKEENWTSVSNSMTTARVREYSSGMIFDLAKKPLADPKALTVVEYFEKSEAGTRREFRTVLRPATTVRYLGNKPQAYVDIRSVLKSFEQCEADWPVEITVMYLAEPTTTAVTRKKRRTTRAKVRRRSK